VLVRALLRGRAAESLRGKISWFRASVCAKVCAAALAVGGRARAAPEPAPYQLTYDAPAECPGRDEVVGHLRSFAPTTTFAEGASAAAVRLVVESAPQPVASILIVRPGQADATRTVPATSCAELVEAAALVIAILIDPEAANRAGAAGADASAGARPQALVRETPTGARPTKPRSEPISNSGRAPRDARAPSDSERWYFGAEGLVGVTWVMAPRATLDTGFGARAESGNAGVFSPWFLLSGHRAQSPDVRFGNASASFQLLSGQLRSCPLRAWIRPWVWLAPCARVELGRLEAQGSASRTSRSPAILWAAAGVFGRAELRLGAANLAAEAGAIFPFRHDTYHFDPSGAPVFTLPTAAFSAGIAAGLTFP
jgi:hypothetical protein